MTYNVFGGMLNLAQLPTFRPTTEGAMHVSVCVICMQKGYLGLIGGLNVKAATVIMKSVMTTQLARLFNFCGKRGKHGFSALQLKEVVCGWCCDLLFFCFFQ